MTAASSRHPGLPPQTPPDQPEQDRVGTRQPVRILGVSAAQTTDSTLSHACQLRKSGIQDGDFQRSVGCRLDTGEPGMASRGPGSSDPQATGRALRGQGRPHRPVGMCSPCAVGCGGADTCPTQSPSAWDGLERYAACSEHADQRPPTPGRVAAGTVVDRLDRVADSASGRLDGRKPGLSITRHTERADPARPAAGVSRGHGWQLGRVPPAGPFSVPRQPSATYAAETGQFGGFTAPAALQGAMP